MRMLLQALLIFMLWTTAAGAQSELDAALCQAQSRLETLRAALVPLDKAKRVAGAEAANATAAIGAIKAMAEENLLIREALYEVTAASWPDEVKRAYVEYFLTSGGPSGLAQRAGAENLALLRALLDSPAFKDAGWPTRSQAGPEADFHAFIVVGQGRGADPQWVAQTLVPRLKKLADAGEVDPLGPAWLAAGGKPDLAHFEGEFSRAGAPWSRYGAQLKGLAALQQLMPSLGAAPRLPALTPAPCGADKPAKAKKQ